MLPSCPLQCWLFGVFRVGEMLMLVRWGDPYHILNTVGSETSKYREEETSNEIPVVVASEAG